MMRAACLCGAVRFTSPALEDPLACHCRECRQQSGHYFAAGRARWDAVLFEADAGLRWYRASDSASRGFCGSCGATLFWRGDDSPYVRVALGALDGPTGLRLGRHVWTDEAGDYYAIADDLPQEGEG